MYSDNNDDDDYDTIFVMMMTMMKVTMMQWRYQSPNETRATAQYKTNHNYDNCKF